MSALTKIQWTDRTWNPVRGCSIVSPGCVNCYAMKQAHRFSGEGRAYEGLTKQTKAGPQWTGQIRTVESALGEPLSWRKPARVFVNSMSDLFHDDVPWPFIERVFDAMRESPRHTFQILTKRAENMRQFAEYWSFHHSRPLPNVWLGVSAEDQQRADERIPLLLQTPAAVRFVSAEPLLGGIDIAKHRPGALGLHWLIAGGESGHSARQSQMWWYRNLRGQCRDAGVAFFLKQLGKNPISPCAQCGRMIGRSVAGGFVDACGPTHAAVIAEHGRIRATKGDDISEWPEDLRVREFPAAG